VENNKNAARPLSRKKKTEIKNKKVSYLVIAVTLSGRKLSGSAAIDLYSTQGPPKVKKKNPSG
jgi:hypothetical protein